MGPFAFAFLVLLFASNTDAQVDAFTYSIFGLTNCQALSATYSQIQSGLCLSFGAVFFKYSSCACTNIAVTFFSDSNCTIIGPTPTGSYFLGSCNNVGTTSSFMFSGTCSICGTSTPSPVTVKIGPFTYTQLGWIIYGGIYVLGFVAGVILFICILCLDSFKAPERKIISSIGWFFGLGFLLPPLDAFSAVFSIISMAKSVPVKWRNSCAKVAVVILAVPEILVGFGFPIVCCIFDLGYAGTTIQNLIALCPLNSCAVPWWLVLVCIPSVIAFWLFCGISRICVVMSMAKGTYGGWDRPKSGAESGGKIELPDISTISDTSSVGALSSSSATKVYATSDVALAPEVYTCLRCDAPTQTDLSLCENCAKVTKNDDY